MHLMIYQELKRVARNRSLTSYAEIARVGRIDLRRPEERHRMFEILGEISAFEARHGRPMLSAVVVSTETYMPRIGFLRHARELGVYKGGDAEAFFKSEIEKVWATYADFMESEVEEREFLRLFDAG